MMEMRASFDGSVSALQQSAAENFRAAFCRDKGCPIDAFERAVFWRCLYPHAVLVAWIILLVRPQFFQNDFKTIRQLGILRRRDEVRNELDSLSYENRQHGGALRNVFKIRVSGKRLMRLHSRMMGPGPR